MKKFDFGKEFGNIDSKYITEAERKWQEKKETWTPRFWSKVAAACVIVTLGSVIFSNPQVQAAIKNLTLSIGETLGFSKEIESYTEVLNTSRTDNGITVTLKEVVVDDGVLLAKVHAEKADSEKAVSGQQKEEADSNENSLSTAEFRIDYQNSTINGQKIDEYGSGSYLPYSIDELMTEGIDENVYDGVLESRFPNSVDLGESPEVHLVIVAYNGGEVLEGEPIATVQFDFSISHGELMKQTVHKKLEDTSIKTDEGTVKLLDFSMNKLQSRILAEIPDELYEKYELKLEGTDSKGNQVVYELNGGTENDAHQWCFKTDFFGMYQMDSEEPVLMLPDIDSEYLELRLYIRELYMAESDTIWDGDDFAEVGETTAEVEEVPDDPQVDEKGANVDEQAETQIIGGAAGSTAIMIRDNGDQDENADIADAEDELYGTEEGAYDINADEIAAGSDTYCGWIPVGNEIKIQIK